MIPQNRHNGPRAWDFTPPSQRQTTPKVFSRAMDDAFQNRYPECNRRQYRQVRVCILGWEADYQDGWMRHLFSRLRERFSSYGYDTACIFLTGYKYAHHSLGGALVHFFAGLGGDDLGIIYYLGDAYACFDGSAETHLYLRPSRVSMPWIPIVDFDVLRRDVIDRAAADVLMILDCPVSLVCPTVPGKEIIAASIRSQSSNPHLFTVLVLNLLDRAVSNKKILMASQIFSHLATKSFFVSRHQWDMLRLPYNGPIGTKGCDQVFLAPPEIPPLLPLNGWGCWPTKPMFLHPVGVILLVRLKESTVDTKRDLMAWHRQSTFLHSGRMEIEDNDKPPRECWDFIMHVTFDLWYSLKDIPGIHFVTFGRIPDGSVLNVGLNERERPILSLASAHWNNYIVP